MPGDGAGAGGRDRRAREQQHRADLARPLLDVWQQAQPDSAQMELNVGWAHCIDGRRDEAVTHLRRALELDAEEENATTLLRQIGCGS